MKIRQAKKEDAHGIALVTVESWQSTYKDIVEEKVLRRMTIEDKTKRWEGKIGDGSILLVVEDEDRIVGYVHAGKERSGSSRYDSELYAIYLLDQYQRQGIGQSMISMAALALSKQKFTSMVVWVMEGNRAEDFYLKLGAQRAGNDQLRLGDTTHLLRGLGWGRIESLIQKTP